MATKTQAGPKPRNVVLKGCKIDNGGVWIPLAMLAKFGGTGTPGATAGGSTKGTGRPRTARRTAAATA